MIRVEGLRADPDYRCRNGGGYRLRESAVKGVCSDIFQPGGKGKGGAGSVVGCPDREQSGAAFEDGAAVGAAQALESLRKDNFRQASTILKGKLVDHDQPGVGEVDGPFQIAAAVKRLLLDGFQMGGGGKIHRGEGKKPQVVVVGDGTLGLFIAGIGSGKRLKGNVPYWGAGLWNPE